jgi:hypothetical protein
MKWVKNLLKRKVKFVGELSSATVEKIIKAKMDKYNYKDYQVYLPDSLYYGTHDKAEAVKKLQLDETNALVYTPDTNDCDDFAVKLFSMGFGLIWTDKHAFNWFIDETTCKLYFVEPQSDTISEDIASWQGSRVRFFLGR